MKKLMMLISLLLLSVSVFAHPYLTPLKQGEWRGAFWFNPFGGYENAMEYAVENDSVLGVYPSVITGSYQTGFTGDYLYAEYGLFDWLSVGVKISPFSFTVLGLQGNGWMFPASLSLRGVFLDDAFDGFLDGAAEVEVGFNPLWADDIYTVWGAGLTSLFADAAFGFRIFETGDLSLSACLDLKYITSFVDPDYDFYLYGMEREALEYDYGQYHRFLVEPGLEFSWGNLNVYLGFNMKVCDWVQSVKYSDNVYSYLHSWDDFISSQDLFGLQLEYVWSF